jgi:hypothetical protein
MSGGEVTTGSGAPSPPAQPCEHRGEGRCIRFAIEPTAEDCHNCRTSTWFVPQMTAMREFTRITDATDALDVRCIRFGLWVDIPFCEVCLWNGYLRQLLAHRLRRARERKYVCGHLRSEVRGEADRLCCGGKIKSFPAFGCDRRTDLIVPEYDCADCSDYCPTGFDMDLVRGSDPASPCPPAGEQSRRERM